MRGLVSGRGPELARARDLLTDVAASKASAAVIEGPAGIGKSTLLAALAEDASDRGFAVFTARSEEMERERAFGAISGLVRTMDAEITELLDAPASQGAAFRIVDRVVDVVETEALRRPVLLSLDDAQWADDWSVKCAGIVFRRLQRLPVGLVVGARPSPRSADLALLLSSLREAGLHLPLAPLDAEAVADLVRKATGAEPTARLRDTLGRAGGNPFFVRELYEALDRDDLLVSGGETVDIATYATPPGLLLTVLNRMRALPPDTLDLVRNAAVLTGSFTVHELAVACERSPETLLEALLGLRDEGILAEEEERFRFRHDLLREAVYEDLGGPVRAAMHARIGHAFASAGFDPADAAHHLLLGAPPGDHRAVELLIAGSESPRVTMRESAALLSRAIELAPGHPQAKRLKRRLATLLQATDAPAHAIRLLQEILASTHDPAEKLELLAALDVAALRAGDRAKGAAWRAEAAELAGELADSSDPWVLINVSQCAFHRGEALAAHEISVRAARLAVAAGDVAAEEEARNRSTWLLTSAGRPQEALAHSRRVLELCPGRPSEDYRLLHHAGVRAGLWEDQAAAAALKAAREVSERRGSVAALLKVLSGSAWLHYSAGRWEEAALDADTALELIRELRIATDADHPGFVRAWLSFRSGDHESAERWQAETQPVQTRLPSQWLTLRLRLERSDFGAALEMAGRVIEHAPKFPSLRFVEEALPEIARLARQVDAPELAEETLQLARRYSAGTSAPSLKLMALRCAAVVEGDTAAAEEALELSTGSPWPLERAGTLEDAAIALADRADELLAEAERTYDQIGSAVDVSRLQRGRGTEPRQRRRKTRLVQGWGALTDAERKVVELAAQGLTNREIGERLFISHRTVGTHLAHSFDKLQVRSRVELASRAAAQRAAAPSFD